MYSKDSTSFDIFNFLKMSWLFLILCSYKESCNDLSQCLLLTREALSRLYKPGRIAFIPRSSQVLLQLDVWLTLLPKLSFCKTWPCDFPAWNLQLAHLHQEITCTVFGDLHKVPPYLASAHLPRIISYLPHPILSSSTELLTVFCFRTTFLSRTFRLSFPCICTHCVLCFEYLSPCNLRLLAFSHASEFNSDATPFGKPILSLLLRWSGYSQYNLSLLKSNCQVNIAFPCPYIKEPAKLSAHDQTWMPWKKPYGHWPSFTEVKWTGAHQAPPSLGFSRQEYWSGLPFPSPGELPNPGIEPRSPAL